MFGDQSPVAAAQIRRRAAEAVSKKSGRRFKTVRNAAPTPSRRAFRIETAAHLGHIHGRRAVTVDTMWHQIHETLFIERGARPRGSR